MQRRDFLSRAGTALGGLMTLAAYGQHRGPSGNADSRPRLRWTRDEDSCLFATVSWEGTPLVRGQTSGLLAGGCRLWDEQPAKMTWLNAKRPRASQGPLRIELRHELHDTGRGLGEDLLEAALTVRNVSDQAQRVELAFATSVQPSGPVEQQAVYVPLNAAGLSGDGRFAALGVKQFLKECNQQVGRGEFTAHYLEPLASYPSERETRALLLAPVVDISHPQAPARIGLFTSSLEPRRFSKFRAGEDQTGWHVGRCVTIPAGQTMIEHCWLLLHEGDARVAWKAFHRFAHKEDHPPIAWCREFKVHYYDFLSSADGATGRRGGGYEADVPHFRAFRIGMATQHGCYPTIGDFIQPDRKTWQAMRGDKQGAVEMSFEKMIARIKATHAAGAKAAVYMHPACFDDATPCFEKLRDALLTDATGQPTAYGWTGPDTVGKNWRTSLGSPQWREHLLQQAQWMMDILRPDAIVMDETFAGLSYDHHPDRAGPTSAGAIDLYRKLRALVRSFGSDKAFFTSDCSMSPFVLWADGEVGDHAYPNLLGHRLYTQEPVRYLAALGDKPWRPCAWHFQHMWEKQMKLARQVGAGVGVSNGWLEYTGLNRLPADVRRKLVANIETLF